MTLNADIVIQNAKVYTVCDEQPYAEAVAIQGNKIVFVGSKTEAQAWIGEGTRVIDGKENTLLPGFIDSHFHLLWGSETLYGAQLQGVKTLEGLAATLHEWAAENPDAPWIIGEGVSYALPNKEEPLTRHHLDAIIADKPLVLVAYDQHSMFVNTAALNAAGIAQGVDQLLLNGEVVLDTAGFATGTLYEMDAMQFIREAMPTPTPEQAIKTLKRGLLQAASYGITSVHNMDGDVEQAALYGVLEEKGELTVRVHIPFWVKPEMTVEGMVTQATTMRNQFQSTMVRSNGVKFFMDGVFESHTAVVLDGYPDQPDNLGEPIWREERFAQFATEADRLGFQIAVHACGDGAVQRVLDGYETAAQRNGKRDSRHRVEHIELIHPDDVSRFAELGVVASMQPLHSPLEENDLDIWPTRVHKERWDNAFAWRTLREAGAKLAFGSDWPVVTQNLFLGLHAALNRQPWASGNNAQTQTLAEAIRGYTRDAAYAEFQETVKGQIQVGMWADVVLLSRDIFAMPEAEIGQVQAMVTICHGRVVFERVGFEQNAVKSEESQSQGENR